MIGTVEELLSPGDKINHIDYKIESREYGVLVWWIRGSTIKRKVFGAIELAERFVDYKRKYENQETKSFLYAFYDGRRMNIWEDDHFV